MSRHPQPTGIVLASGSPRRRALLGRLGVPFVVDAGDSAERDPRPGEDPAGYALELAEQKAASGAKRHPGAVVLGADTVVTIDHSILGKPQDEDRALEMLRRLRGTCHHVITAVAVRCSNGSSSGTVRSEVCMYPVSDDDLQRYIATGEPMDKAGSYALQGLGGRFVESISGCYNNIVGLPLCLAARLLEGCGQAVEIDEGIDVHVTAGSPRMQQK